MKKRGEITVFLVLILSSVMSLIFVLTASVKRFMIRSEAILAMDNAVMSCFAEYNRELFDTFHILLVDSSYKGDTGGRDRVLEHFETYLFNSLSSNEVISTRIVSCSDAAQENYEYLYKSALRYAKSELGDDADFTDYLSEVLEEGEMDSLIQNEELSDDELIKRFADYLTVYLKEHGSPGFDLTACYHDIEFEAELKGASNREYTVRLDYEYDIEDF